MAKTLHLDFETRSDLDLKATGLHVYAKGRHTDILCAAYSFDDGPVNLWLPGQKCPASLYSHIESGGEVHAHNAVFEQELCNNVATRLYSWPYIYPEQLVCTMAMAYAMGLPGSLAGAAAALGVAQQKDLAGQRVMLQCCQPRTITEDGKIIWWDDAQKLNQIYEYCKTDVEVERTISKRMFRLSPYEKEVYLLDQKINSKGICIDTKAVFAATSIVEQEKVRLNSAIQKASNNEISTFNSVAQIKNFLKSKGVEDVEGLAKADVIELLENEEINLPRDCREVLKIRQEAGKASTAKFEAMLTGVSSDNRLRGTFQYSGANTRRWSGRRIQLQNLKRPTIKQSLIDDIIERLPKGLSASEMDTLYGSPLDTLSNCLRGFLVAAPGHDLLVADFSAIEARVLAWLSGQESVLEIFRTHGKIYEHEASRIFSKSINKVTAEERQVGKVAVLALGYQGGVGALQAMAKGYGVKLAPCFKSLWALADTSSQDWAEKMWQGNKKESVISREEYLASELTKIFWRKGNPNTVQFWNDIEEAAIKSVLNPGHRIDARSVSYLTKGSFLFCKLPGGGVISYPYPAIQSIETPWGLKKEGLTYKAEDSQSKKWLRFKTFGGSLVENITQAVARDLLADAMLRLDKKGYAIVGHVHDEVICEVHKSYGSVDEMSEIMCDSPLWAKGIPMAAAGWRDIRYRK